MKFTINWLKQFIDSDQSPEDIAHHLTMLGLEVDSMHTMSAGLKGVMVGRVLEVTAHPNADTLRLCVVDVGLEKKKVVCGAPNVRVNMLAPLAVVGSVLPQGQSIQEARIRGEVSEGMLCSEKDLGLGDDHTGIMDLPTELIPGTDLIDALCLDDVLIEVDLTPNRPDCTSVMGIAREVGAINKNKVKEPIKGPLPVLDGSNIPFSVDVESVEDCPRYVARLLKNVTIGPSPLWLRNRLRALGVRSINNVVDITNFVMLEYGQPLHAFDFHKLAGGKIVVRRPREGEKKIITLDGVERNLHEDTLLICDGEKPVAIAGIMGAENSEVIGSTKEILLESACFAPLSIRKTTRKLNLHTDASYRFERGVDPFLAPKAMERALQLIVEMTGAMPVENGVDFREGVKENLSIRLRVSRVNDLLGICLTVNEIVDKLALIDIPAIITGENELTVTPPSFRVDLEREVDLIEEIARLVGYNQIPTVLPVVPMHFPEEDEGRRVREKASQVMTAAGFFEVVNYSFTDESHFDRLLLPEQDNARNVIKLLNPLAEDQSVMRTTLLPGLLENARRNINFQNNSFRLFEVGKVFEPSRGQLPREALRLAGVMSGRRYGRANKVHFRDTDQIDIYDVKGVVELFFSEMDMQGVLFYFGHDEVSFADPEMLIIPRNNKEILGSLGKINQSCLQKFNIKQDLYYFDIDLEALTVSERAPKVFKSLPKFLPVTWDLAVIVSEEVNANDMVRAIVDFEDPLIESAEIFDIYRGKPIEVGSKSIALTVTYRSSERTLDDETVGKVHARLIEMMLSRFKGQLREI